MKSRHLQICAAALFVVSAYSSAQTISVGGNQIPYANSAPAYTLAHVHFQNGTVIIFDIHIDQSFTSIPQSSPTNQPNSNPGPFPFVVMVKPAGFAPTTAQILEYKFYQLPPSMRWNFSIKVRSPGTKHDTAIEILNVFDTSGLPVTAFIGDQTTQRIIVAPVDPNSPGFKGAHNLFTFLGGPKLSPTIVSIPQPTTQRYRKVLTTLDEKLHFPLGNMYVVQTPDSNSMRSALARFYVDPNKLNHAVAEIEGILLSTRTKLDPNQKHSSVATADFFKLYITANTTVPDVKQNRIFRLDYEVNTHYVTNFSGTKSVVHFMEVDDPTNCKTTISQLAINPAP